jgi:hypothetical protein
MGQSNGAPEARYWLTDSGETAVSGEGDPLWIHPHPRGEPEEEDPPFPARRRGKQKREFRPDGKKDGRTEETVPESLKRRRFLACALRLFTLGALFAAGYLVLAGRACSPVGI